jgi:hypothetical protein
MEPAICDCEIVERMNSAASKVVGLYRCPGIPPFACVMEGARCSYVSQDAYRANGHKPDFEALPWESDYRAARKP